MHPTEFPIYPQITPMPGNNFATYELTERYETTLEKS